MYSPTRGSQSNRYRGPRGVRGGSWSARGSWNARGSRNARSWPTPPEVTTTPDPPFGTLVRSIVPGDVDVADYQVKDADAAITDSELVASFNWLDAKEPTIVVPGGPPRWTPLARPVRLGQDMGTYFRDVNSAHFPPHPMEPSVLAALGAAGELDVDVVACGSTLGNLLRFVRADALDELRDHKPIRMVAQLGDEGTVFFVRRENSPRELIPGVRGFGHAFPEAYTTWDPDVKKSVSHQRLLRYRFGGLRLLVRSEADGYLPEKGVTVAVRGASSSNNADIDQLLAEATISSGSANTPSSDAPQGQLKVQSGGTLQPQDAVFDLKTRSARKKDEDMLGKELPRLWVRQIPTLVLAYHDDGLFNDIQVLDVRDQIKAWEAEQKGALQKLATLLHLIIAELRKAPSGKLEICHRDMGRLDIRQPGAGATDALSAETWRLWADRKQTPHGLDSDDAASSDEGGGAGSEDDAYLSWSEDEEEKDLTACSSECGYCGRCTY